MTGARSSRRRACGGSGSRGTRRGRTSPGQQVLDIDFQLLSDWNGDATHGFGVAFDYRGLRDVSERTAFLIDQGGTVRGAWRYESSELPDVDELLSAARALQD